MDLQKIFEGIFFKLKNFITSFNLKNIFTGKIALALKCVTAIFLLFIIYVLFFWIFTHFAWDSKTIERYIQNYTQENFARASRFNSLRINIFANIEIMDIAMSNSADFNDNINFLYAPKAILSLKYTDFFRGKISIKGINFKNCEFNIYKDHSSNLRDVFERNLGFLQLDKLNSNTEIALSRGFNLTAADAKLRFFERAVDLERVIEIYDFNLKASIADESIKVKCFGEIYSHVSHDLNNSKFVLNFENYSKGKKLSLDIMNFDLSYLNAYKFAIFKHPIIFHGGMDVKTDIVFEEDEIKYL